MTGSRVLVCPRCGGRMRPYDRSEIDVDECEDCRGMFLDQGELERLIDAEGGGWSGRIIPPAERAPDATRQQAGRGPHGDVRPDGGPRLSANRASGARDGRPGISPATPRSRDSRG